MTIDRLLQACGWQEVPAPPLSDPNAELLRARLRTETIVDDADARAIADWASNYQLDLDLLFRAASPQLASYARRDMHNRAWMEVRDEQGVLNAVLTCYVAGFRPTPDDAYAWIGETCVTFPRLEAMRRDLDDADVRVIVVTGGLRAGKTLAAEILAAERDIAVDRIELDLDWRGGAVEGLFDMETELANLRRLAAPLPIPVDYLRHDPTKRHTWGQAKRRMRRERGR